jgi:RNA polymerase II subunit A small phosphatase-like protein
LTVEPPNNHNDDRAPPLLASSSAQPLPVAASAVPAAVLRANVDEPDREQGSLNTTLTANNRRIPFYRRKTSPKSSTSEVAFSSSTSPSLIKLRRESSRSRPSFLSRVVYRVVPCVSPDPSVANNDADDASEPRRSLALKEITSVRPVDHDMDPSNLDIHSAVDADASASLPLTVPPVTIQIELPPSPTDSEVIVPPPPSAHLLPEDETDGLTSGAVQPPGSTGDHIIRTNTHDSEDSDGTSYTDDEGEDRRMQDEQDEEERLIRSGGSGIPIGPVRPPTLLPC